MLRIFSFRRSVPTSHQKSIANFLKLHFNITTRQVELYEAALTHKSYSQTAALSMQNNERLEFLGDSVLSTIVTHILYERFPQKMEGELTQMRARIVSRENLNKLGKSIGLEPFIQYQKSKNEHLFLLGNAFESFIGALYLDKGYDKVYSLLEDQIFELHLDFEVIETKNEDFKSQLIIHCQKNKLPLRFVVDEENQLEGRIQFVVSVWISDKQETTASAYSKRKAEQLASKMYLERVMRDKENS
jgi:ribonuclease-3